MTQDFLQGMLVGAAALFGAELALGGALLGWAGWLILGEREWPRLVVWPPAQWGMLE